MKNKPDELEGEAETETEIKKLEVEKETKAKAKVATRAQVGAIVKATARDQVQGVRRGQ